MKFSCLGVAGCATRQGELEVEGVSVCQRNLQNGRNGGFRFHQKFVEIFAPPKKKVVAFSMPLWPGNPETIMPCFGTKLTFASVRSCGWSFCGEKNCWKEDAINENVDPGEYGMENFNCRAVCLFLFTLSVMHEMLAKVQRCRGTGSGGRSCCCFPSCRHEAYCLATKAGAVASAVAVSYVVVVVVYY